MIQFIRVMSCSLKIPQSRKATETLLHFSTIIKHLNVLKTIKWYFKCTEVYTNGCHFENYEQINNKKVPIKEMFAFFCFVFDIYRF